LFLQVFIVSNSTAANTEPPSLRFAVYDSLPFGYLDDKGRPQGTVVDIAHLIATEANIPIKIDLVPVSRALRELTTGNADLTILLDRANSVDSIEQIGLIESTRTVLIRLKNEQTFDASDLSNKNISIGFVRGAYYGKEFSAFLKDKTVQQIQVVNAQTGIELLLRKRIDYLSSLEISLAHALITQVKSEQIEPVKFFKTYNSALYISSHTKK
jgi:hypothetical protein